MSKENFHKRRDVIAEEAAGYLIELESPQPDTKARFGAWLKTSPEHVEEFLAVAELWGTLPDVAEQPGIEELVALATREENVVDLATVAGANGQLADSATSSTGPDTLPGAAARRFRHWGPGLAAAAAVAAVAIFSAVQFLPSPIDPDVHTTAVGEQSSLPLPDGSLVMINTRSTLRVAYSDQFRDVYLASGEALFDVTTDPDRPFRVITDNAVVTAIGTQFNVRHVADDVVVTVVEGIVDVEATPPPLARPTVVEPARLTVGQQAHVAAGEVAVVEAAVDKATAWRERRLVFESMTLAEVIDEFNRYNDPPLMIEDPNLGAIPISGVFRANDRASFVGFLQTMSLAESEVREDGTIVLRRLDVQE